MLTVFYSLVWLVHNSPRFTWRVPEGLKVDLGRFGRPCVQKYAKGPVNKEPMTVEMPSGRFQMHNEGSQAGRAYHLTVSMVLCRYIQPRNLLEARL